MSADISFLFRKTSINVLSRLVDGGKRFRELEGSASPAAISQRVRELEKLGLIKRNVTLHPGEPALLYYELTDHGRQFLEMYNNIVILIQQRQKLIM